MFTPSCSSYFSHTAAGAHRPKVWSLQLATEPEVCELSSEGRPDMLPHRRGADSCLKTANGGGTSSADKQLCKSKYEMSAKKISIKLLP